MGETIPLAERKIDYLFIGYWVLNLSFITSCSRRCPSRSPRSWARMSGGIRVRTIHGYVRRLQQPQRCLLRRNQPKANIIGHFEIV